MERPEADWKRWDKEGVSRVLKLLASGLKIKDVAKEMGRTPAGISACLNKHRRLGFPWQVGNRPIGRLDMDKVWKVAWGDGGDLAERNDRVLAHKLNHRGKQTPRTYAYFYDYCVKDRNRTIRQIAEEHGVSNSTVMAGIKKFGAYVRRHSAAVSPSDTPLSDPWEHIRAAD